MAPPRSAFGDPPQRGDPSGPAKPDSRRPLGWVRWTCAVLALFVVGAAIVFSVAWWALRSESGTARLLAWLPGIEVEAPKGALLGDFDARRVTIRLSGGKDTIEITELASRGLRISRSSGTAWVHIDIDALRARRVEVKLAQAKSSEPAKPPADLQLPIELAVRSLRVGELFASPLGAAPLRELQAQLQLGALHRIDALSVGWDRLRATGRAQIASRAPFAVEMLLNAEQDAAQAGRILSLIHI